MRKVCSFFIFCFLAIGLYAQTTEQANMLRHFEDSLIKMRKTVLRAPNNAERIATNELFTKTFGSILSQGVSYNYNFDSIPSIGNLTSPDGTFRIITWNLPFNDGTHEYFCFVQTKFSNGKGRKKSGNFSCIQLIDKSSEIESPEKKVLSNENWFGALYYEIIPVKSGNKTYYTVLGWDGNDKFTSKKIIDVMYFNGTQIKFGAPIFKTSTGIKKRVIFEYSADASMSVKYYAKEQQIVYDHLSPMREDLKGIRQYYVPDMSFDALEMKKDKWVYIPDLDARNKENILMPYNVPK